MKLIDSYSENEQEIYRRIRLRGDYEPWAAEAAIGVLRAIGLSDEATYRAEGQAAVCFKSPAYEQVQKIRRLNPDFPDSGNPFVLKPVQHFPLNHLYDILVSPYVEQQGVTKHHQDVLRYEIWRRGDEFWDYLPPSAAPDTIKNVGLSKEGLPYVFDEAAVKKDRGPELFGADYAYEKGPDGLYTPDAFRKYWRDQQDFGMSEKEMEAAIAHDFTWPETQREIFHPQLLNGGKDIDRELLARVEEFVRSAVMDLQSTRAQNKLKQQL